MSTQPILSISEARAQLAPVDFRLALRRTLLDNPALKLQEVATQLGVSRQAVGAMVGRLDRPTCAHPNRPAPKREAAKMKLADLSKRVAAGESPRAAADGLGISLAAAAKLGWRAKDVRPPHGKGRTSCNCWRCRRAIGVTIPRGPRANPAMIVQVLDWLAWTDPDSGLPLTQAVIGDLVGVGQPVVSRLTRAVVK